MKRVCLCAGRFRRRNRLVRIGILVWLGAFGAFHTVQAQDRQDDSSLAAGIDEVVAPYLQAKDFQGVIGVHREGQAPLILPYGFASIELNVPHQSDGEFMIGSVSKQFTAAAILRLEETGLLGTEDTIDAYLPDFPQASSITIEQLLTHTAGVGDIYSLREFGLTGGHGGTFPAVISALARSDFSHPPGQGYAYSNGGYALLAAVIEEVSGVSYGDYLRRTFFEPLGMMNTGHDQPGPARRGRVSGYDPWGKDQLTPAIPISSAFSTGSGSLWSSAEDLLLWSSALHNGEVLSVESYRKFTRDYGNGYGFGVSGFKRFGRNVIGHDGRISGFASDLARYVDEGLSVVVLSNVQSVARDEVRRLVAAVAMGEELGRGTARSFLNEPSTPLSDLVGVYSFGPGFRVAITTQDGRLLARANEGGTSELVPLTEGRWFSRMLYATVRFERDTEGIVNRLVWGEGKGAPVGTKVR